MPTTIQIGTKTLERLQYYKVYGKESYDEILNKLIDTIEEGELSSFAIEGILRGMEDVKAGKVKAIQAVARKFGIAFEE